MYFLVMGKFSSLSLVCFDFSPDQGNFLKGRKSTLKNLNYSPVEFLMIYKNMKKKHQTTEGMSNSEIFKFLILFQDW
jgi:hypothetical protein